MNRKSNGYHIISMLLSMLLISHTASVFAQDTKSPLYRFWSDQNGSHFYTMDEGEKNYIIGNYSADVWKYEQIAWYAYTAENAPSGSKPIYRFWSDQNGSHFFTISESEKDYIITNYPSDIWGYEGISYYAFSPENQPQDGIPVYRFWSDQNGSHFFTMSETEKNYIRATYPESIWRYEGIAWYAFAGPPPSVNEEGGQLAFLNGIKLDIPPGAVEEETEIEVTILPCEQVDAILTAQGTASNDIRCLGGFTGKPDGQEFILPVTATVPVLPLAPGEIPIQIKVNVDEQKYYLAPTTYQYSGESGVAEMEIQGFSTNIAAGLSIDEGSDWSVPLPPCCNKTTIQKECCCSQHESVSEYSALFISQGNPSAPVECTIAAEKLTTTYPLCPGEPQQTSLVQETTEDCPEDMKCRIAVDRTLVNLFVCQEKQLNASIHCEDGDGNPLSFSNTSFMLFWRSDNEFAAKVNPRNGKVHGENEGFAQVEATWGVPNPNFTSAQATINVQSNVRSIRVSPSLETIMAGDGIILDIEVEGADGSLLDVSGVTWSSSNSDIAYVTQGTGGWTSVQGVKKGTVIVTAKYQYDCEEKLITATINVECPKISLALSSASETIEAGSGRILSVELLDELSNAMDASSVTWVSSDPDIAYVTQETGAWTSVEGVKEGIVGVTATYDDGCQKLQETATINVECPDITFAVSPTTQTLTVGDDVLLIAEGYDKDDIPLDVSSATWAITGGDPSVVELLLPTAPHNSVKAVKPGWVEITATYDDGCQVLDRKVVITVEQLKVALVPDKRTITVGQSFSLRVLVMDQAGVLIDGGCPDFFRWSIPSGEIIAFDLDTRTVIGVNPGGPVTITVTCAGVSDSATVIVKDNLIPDIEPSSICLTIGETLQMTATILDEEGNLRTDIIYSWSSSNSDVISIDSITGLASGTGPGPATITVKAITPEGETSYAYLQTSVGVGNVKVEPRHYELGVHGGLQLRVTLLDYVDGNPILEITPYIIPWVYGRPAGLLFIPYSDPNFTPYSIPGVSYNLISWKSSDESIATVNKYGHIHGVSEGKAVITSTVLPGSDVEESSCATVSVSNKPVLNRVTTFYERVRSCSSIAGQYPIGTPHPFSFDIDWDGENNVYNIRAGGSLGIALLSGGTDIGGIENPADLNYSFATQTYTLPQGFEIVLYAAGSTECGGHRYVGIEHAGMELLGADGAGTLIYRPIYKWYLFENYIDVPAGWHLSPSECIDGVCIHTGKDNPEWDPAPTPYWWEDEDYEWLWDW